MRTRMLSLLIAISCFAVTTAQAQCSITLDELREACKIKDNKEFVKHIITKGFIVHDSISNETQKMCTCAEYLSPKAVVRLDRGKDPAGNPDILFQTPDKQFYEDVMAKLEKDKYIFQQEMPFSAYNNPTRQFIYQKDDKMVSIFTYMDRNSIRWYAARLYWTYQP